MTSMSTEDPIESTPDEDVEQDFEDFLAVNLAVFS